MYIYHELFHNSHLLGSMKRRRPQRLLSTDSDTEYNENSNITSQPEIISISDSDNEASQSSASFTATTEKEVIYISDTEVPLPNSSPPPCKEEPIYIFKNNFVLAFTLSII